MSRVAEPRDPAAPAREDPVVAGASTLAGGPRGRFARGRAISWWTPLRAVLVITVLVSVGGFLAKSPCRTHGWTGEYQYTRVCYSDVYALYFTEKLGGDGETTRLDVPYRDHPVEYPPVIGGLMWTAAEITNFVHPNAAADGTASDHRAETFFDVTALMLALFAMATTWAIARLAGRRRVWDAAMFALAPGLFFHEYTNWDMAAVALTALAMWAWTKRWPNRLGPIVAGVLIGVGTATKLYPVLLLVVLFFLCWRAARLVEWAFAAGAAVAAFVVAYVPAWILSASTPTSLRDSAFQFPDPTCSTAHYLPGWRWFWSLNQTRGSDWDSLWFQVEHFRHRALDSPTCGHAPTTLNLWVAVGVLTVVGLVSLLVFAAPRRPRVAQVFFLLLAGFLLVNKVDSPQYVLWLLPLAVLARPRWRAFLAWQAAEVVLLFARFYYFINNDAVTNGLPHQGIPIIVFFGAVWLRDVTLLVLMALVVRDVLRPRHDVVRADGADDPAGGPLDRAPDRWDQGRALAGAAPA